MSKAKVYVVQETEHNFAPAEIYGELVFLSVVRRDDFHNIVHSEHNARLLAHLKRGLREYDPATDWLVLAGSPYVSAAVMWIMGRSQFSTIRLLRWDNRDHMYIPLQLNMKELFNG